MKDKYIGTQTLECLYQAFAAESKARNKYTYYASQAKKEGYEQIAEFFQKTADNEKEHAKIWFKELYTIDDTADNLLDAINGENHEWVYMYEEYARIAESEGFRELAHKFRLIAGIEREHEERFKRLFSNVTTSEVFKKCEIKIWQCRNCGCVFISKEAPDTCPACDHPQAYFELKVDNY